MRKENEAIKKLTHSKSKVSCHYFIKNNGDILTMVPELYIAWHAGISFWKKYKSINKHSIGIEISNSGHDNKYTNFNKRQIKSVLKLTQFLIQKYKIKSKFILGHSDISPDRKKDPGEKFPWKDLFKKHIGMWHDLNKKILTKKVAKTLIPATIPNSVNIFMSVVERTKKPTAVVKLVIRVINPIVFITYTIAFFLSFNFSIEK